ncbi:hypothetical protein HGRIS_006225 [Hohenbuehelia grisea]|uniref:Uncharacterized protein n=1 Tax=Hohenbuehelia grisea TaxID=104357 RepID=A0ABR3K1V9_9AGAR
MRRALALHPQYNPLHPLSPPRPSIAAKPDLMAPNTKTSKLHALACTIQRKLHLGGHSAESSKQSSTTASEAASTSEAATTTATAASPSEAVVAAATVDATSLEGKVAIVTGSSRSIGAAVAKTMGEKGAKVVVNYVNDARAADEVVNAIKGFNKGGDAVAVKADASTIEGGQHLLNEAVKAFGKVDILVLNAGIMGSKTMSDVDEEFFDAHFNINVKVPLFLAKAAVPLMPARESNSLWSQSKANLAHIIMYSRRQNYLLLVQFDCRYCSPP